MIPLRIDNIKWHPVRLGLERVNSKVWWISRERSIVGRVCRTAEGWTSTRAFRGKDGETLFDLLDKCSHKSFVGAVLSVSRKTGIYTGKVQDFGQVRMLRLNVNGMWFTVIKDGDSRYLYQDFTIPDSLTDDQQIRLKRVLLKSEEWFDK